MLTFDKSVAARMLDDARQTFPDECCGFLFGHEDNDGDRHFTEIMPVDNSKDGDRRRRFEVSARDYLRAERLADAQGLQLLGVYHSHPLHPAIPSETDRAAAQPYFSYVIASVFGEEVRAVTSWQLGEGQQFEQEKLAHIDGVARSRPANLGFNSFIF